MIRLGIPTQAKDETMATVICEIELCYDCTNLHANGEVSPDFDVTQPYPLSALLPGESITLGMAYDRHADKCPNREANDMVAECDCERTEFGTGYCDGCNTHLAGYRHAATLWED